MRPRTLLRLVVLTTVCSAAGCAAVGRVRKPAVAGTFYPADPKELAKMVDGFLAQATVPAIKDLVAVVSPHAGYPYSGPVAAYSYALLKGRKVERVVVISPSHVDSFGFSAVFDGTAYATPLGQVPVDQAFSARLGAAGSLVRLSSRGHTVSGGRAEHALEVQLPFLQRALGQFQLVAVVMGDQSYEASRALGLALATLIQGSGTIIVASSDLSHYHPYAAAVSLDRKTLRAIEEWDYLSLSRNLERRVWEACGGGPIVAAMIAAERLGARQATLLKYANSGDTAGDKSQVVGYGAMAFSKSGGGGGVQFSLSEQEQRELLSLAKRSVESVVNSRKLYDYKVAGSESLTYERGAFVTLKKKGALRGCIGYSSALKPLALTVRDVAAYAAVDDTRFAPVTPPELGELEYEISVLSPLRRILDVNEIQVGRDGLVMKKGDREGLLLPQVAPEQHWDRMKFLEQTCLKAGLAPSAWQDADTEIFAFTALVFGDQTGPGR
ncbi:MAG: AmmeMemoRadiSam system protein B [Acidobacteria bacterium]|nr:AmmeMemoRadiSam system protein B [Acidobacteriota bacterium]